MSARRLVLLILLVAAAPVGAQEARLSAFQTDLVLETDGRSAECDMLRFTPDGEHLLGCGDDKIVRSMSWNGKTLRNEPQATLRWSIFRERRGNIYAMALSPDATKVAVGGLGIRDGSAAVLDRATGEVLYGVTRKTNQSPDQKTIWSIAFSPSAERVAYGSEGGHVWAWDLKAQQVRRLGSHVELLAKRNLQLPSAKAVLSSPVRLVTFLDEDRILSVGQDGAVLEWNWNRLGAPKTLTQFQSVNVVVNVAYDPVHKRLAACGEGTSVRNVELVGLDGSGRATLEVPQLQNSDNNPRHLAFDPAGNRLAVGTHQQKHKPVFYHFTGGCVSVFDLTRPGSPGTIVKQLAYNAIALTWHSTQNVLAVAGGDNHDITVLQMTREVRTLSTLAGPGQCLWEVGLALKKDYNDLDRGKKGEVFRDLYQIGFKSARAPIPSHPNHRGKAQPYEVFDLTERHWANPNEQKAFSPRLALDTYNGWGYEPHNQEAMLWYAVSPVGQRLPLRLDGDDGYPRCYTFIPGVPGAPPRIAVGHFWGFSIFTLDGGAAKLVRKCVGHQGEVMSIAPSPDGKLLVTASRDQTICCWSLAEWPGHPEMGVTFRPDGNRLRVVAVADGSPGAEILKPGDLIGGFEYDRASIAGAPDVWLDTIKHAQPGRYCGFTKMERDGKPLEGPGVQSSMRQRPLWRFFPMEDREWILWRHADFFYDTSTKGDFRIGWQLSREVDQKPEFYRAEMFRASFHRPDKVAEIIRVAERAKVEAIPIPQIRPPEVTLEVLVGPTPDANARVRVTAKRRGEGADQSLMSVNLWVNDYLFKEMPATGDAFRREIDVPRAAFRAGRNQLTAQAFSRSEVRDEVTKKVEMQRAVRKPNLYGVVIGVDDYSQVSIDGKMTFGKSMNLSAGTDAVALKDGWEGQRGKLFGEVEIRLLKDQDVTRAKVLAAVAELKAKAGADDYFLISLGGHGETTEDLVEKLQGANKKFLEKPRPQAFIYLTAAIDLTRPYSTGLDGEEIFKSVRDLPCRKIVLLDTCHSGSKVNPVRKLAPQGLGPIVISSCEPHQLSRDDPGIGSSFFARPVGGLFTISILLALGEEFDDAAKSKDGPAADNLLRADRLASYLRLRVPKLLATRDTDAAQNPVAFVPDSERDLPLAGK